LKNNEDETSEGLNQIFEILNAKGDVGELKEIVEPTTAKSNQSIADMSE
jgi:hypothetical protein